MSFITDVSDILSTLTMSTETIPIKSEFGCGYTLPQQHTITKICIEDNDDDIDIIDVSDEEDLGDTLTGNHVLEELNISDAKYLSSVIDKVQNGAKHEFTNVKVKEEPKSDSEDPEIEIDDNIDLNIVKKEPISHYSNKVPAISTLDSNQIFRPKRRAGQVAKKSTTPNLKASKAALTNSDGDSINVSIKKPCIVIKDCLKPYSLPTTRNRTKPPKQNDVSKVSPNMSKVVSLSQFTRLKPRKSVPRKKVAAVVEEMEEVEEEEEEAQIVDMKPIIEEMDIHQLQSSLGLDTDFSSHPSILGTLTPQDDYMNDYGIDVGEDDDEGDDENGHSFRQKPLRGFSGKYLCTECDHSFSALSNLQRHAARFHASGEINLPKCHICHKVFIWKKYLDEHLESVHNHVPTCPECGTVLKNRKTLEAHIKFVHGKKEEYPCDLCGKMFHQRRSLQAHMTVHAPRKFCCEACPRQFRLATHLKYHIRQAHTRENLVHCQICGFGFTHGARLKVHMLTHFKIRPHKCHLCPSAFANKTQLRIHIMRHKGEKKHFCKVCGQGFVCGSALRIHSRVHTGEKPYECDICHQNFATTGNRKIHMRLKHTRERPYSCSVCGKTFNLSNGLKAHMRIHTDEKPYSCDLCGKSFRQSSHLHTHKRTHTGERPFPCPHCYKTFTQQSHLTTHLVTHTGEKTYRCQVCDKSFALAHSLKVHMRLHGTHAYKCNMCGEQFVTWNQYKAHQESECAVEESVCSVCDKSFREPGALVEHMKIHLKQATHMCNVCGKTFQHQCSLTSHMKIHTGERRFACDICNASFAQSSHLKSHITQKHKYK